MDFELCLGDWCYVWGDDVFVQITKIEKDNYDKVKHVYAHSTFDGLFMDGSWVWLGRSNEDPEVIFQSLSYNELEQRELKNLLNPVNTISISL